QWWEGPVDLYNERIIWVVGVRVYVHAVQAQDDKVGVLLYGYLNDGRKDPPKLM
ncbi:unnamed protein product, partial [Durusdinium trenchii]